MSDNKNDPVDTETILITLDQVSQTIDIMTNVVGRLRGYITEQLDENSGDAVVQVEEPAWAHKASQTLH